MNIRILSILIIGFALSGCGGSDPPDSNAPAAQEEKHAEEGGEAHEDGHEEGNREEGGETTRVKLSAEQRSEEHTSELQSLMRISYAVFCLKKKNTKDIK